MMRLPSCSAADVLQAGVCSSAEEDQHSVPRGRRVRRHSEPLRQVLQRLGAGGGWEGAAVGEQQSDQLHQRLSRELTWFTRVTTHLNWVMVMMQKPFQLNLERTSLV